MKGRRGNQCERRGTQEGMNEAKSGREGGVDGGEPSGVVGRQAQGSPPLAHLCQMDGLLHDADWRRDGVSHEPIALVPHTASWQTLICSSLPFGF